MTKSTKTTTRNLAVLTGNNQSTEHPTPDSMQSSNTQTSPSLSSARQTAEPDTEATDRGNNMVITVDLTNQRKKIFNSAAHIKEDAPNKVDKIALGSVNIKNTLKTRQDYEKFVEDVTFALQQLGVSWVLEVHPEVETTLVKLCSFQGVDIHGAGGSKCFQEWSEDLEELHLCTDRKVKGFLLSNIDTSLRREFMNEKSSYHIMCALQKKYAKSVDTPIKLQEKLFDLKLGSKSVTDFFNEFDSINAKLVGLGAPLSDTTKVAQLMVCFKSFPPRLQNI